MIAVEPSALCLLYQSLTGPFSKPEVKSKCTGLLKNSTLVAAIIELDGAREGVKADGTRAKEESRKHSSKPARSSLTDEGRKNLRNEGIVNCCLMLVRSMDSIGNGEILTYSAHHVYSMSVSGISKTALSCLVLPKFSLVQGGRV